MSDELLDVISTKPIRERRDGFLALIYRLEQDSDKIRRDPELSRVRREVSLTSNEAAILRARQDIALLNEFL